MDVMFVAKAYVEASNAHDLDAVERLLSEDAVYLSTGVGEHLGKRAIRAMMDTFFQTYKTLHWQTRNWESESENVASFDFVMTGMHCETGNKIEKAGREGIFMGKDGLINRIEVRA